MSAVGTFTRYNSSKTDETAVLGGARELTAKANYSLIDAAVEDEI